MSLFEGVLDHGEREGWGMWFDPEVAEDPIWQDHWADVESVSVRIGEGYIVLEPDRREEPVADPATDLTAFGSETGRAAEGAS